MIYIYDFNDSFTYNLFSDLYHYSKVEVIAFKDISNHLNSLLETDDKYVVVLGPGPGHPDEYEFLTPVITKLLNSENIFTFGICLGHQLIWKNLGMKVKRSSNPVHGQSEKIEFDKFYSDSTIHSVTMQRYNSLSVNFPSNMLKEFNDQGWQLVTRDHELLMSRNKNVLTYQFHPESIGSMRKELLYSPVREFLL